MPACRVQLGTYYAALTVRGCLAFMVATVSLAAPGSTQAQVFSDVIENIFSVGESCGAFGISPIGTLATLCGVVGTDLAGPSGGSPTALTNESPPAKERLFDQENSHLNVFFSADYEHFQKQVTKFEPGYKNYIWRGALGADYLMDSVTLGGALRYVHDNGKFGGTGDPKFETNAYGLIVYASTAPSEDSYVSGSLQYMRQDFDIERAISFDTDGSGSQEFLGTTRGKPDGNEFQVQVNGGYVFRQESFTVSPIVGVNYLYDVIDDYSESGNTGLELKYSDLEQQSLTSRVGANGSVAISTSFGVIVPQVTGEYVHEFLDPQRTTDFNFAEDLNQVRFRFENDDPDRDYFEVGAGVVLQLAHGIAPFISFRTLLGYNQYSSRQVTAGARFEF